MRRTFPSLLLALLLLLAACGDGDGDVAIDDLDDDVDDTEDVVGQDDEAPEEDEGDTADEPEPEDEGPEEDEQEADDDPGPQPDPGMVADPCAEREGQEFDAFLDVISPVDGQQVLDSVDLIGCANVPEGTVRYRVVAEDGSALVDDFTTAECGGPCVGEYSTVVDLADVAGEHDVVTLEVFWDSPAGEGGEEDLTAVELHLE